MKIVFDNPPGRVARLGKRVVKRRTKPRSKRAARQEVPIMAASKRKKGRKGGGARLRRGPGVKTLVLEGVGTVAGISAASWTLGKLPEKLRASPLAPALVGFGLGMLLPRLMGRRGGAMAGSVARGSVAFGVAAAVATLTKKKLPGLAGDLGPYQLSGDLSPETVVNAVFEPRMSYVG